MSPTCVLWCFRLSLVLIPAVSLVGVTGCPESGDVGESLDTVRAVWQAYAADAPALGLETDVGVERLGDWEGLPTFRNSRYRQYSSHHREPGSLPLEPGGKDFNSFVDHCSDGPPLLLETYDHAACTFAAPGEFTLARVTDGPGFVSRMFFTRFEALDVTRGASFFENAELGRFGEELLRVYVDDMQKPAFTLPLADVGVADPFAAPLAGRHSAALLCYTPISFRENLRVALIRPRASSGYYYQVDVQEISEPTRSFSPRLVEDTAFRSAVGLLGAIGSNPNRGFARVVDDQVFRVGAGAMVTIHEATAGVSGTIELVQLRFSQPAEDALAAVRLSVRYGSAKEAAIDLPLDALFGLGEAVAPYKTLPMRVAVSDDVVDACLFLPLPFDDGISLALRNTGERSVSLRATVGRDSALPASPWGYLHAHHAAVAGPQEDGSRFRVIEVEGRGRYVGTFLQAAGRSDDRPGELPAALNILEGNEWAKIDGEVRIRGTGTEDYYNGGFYFADGPVNHPFGAANYVDGGFKESGRISCCRWHVLSDAIDFGSSFELRFQYGSDNPAIVQRYATTAYYYLDRPEGGRVRAGSVLSASGAE